MKWSDPDKFDEGKKEFSKYLESQGQKVYDTDRHSQFCHFDLISQDEEGHITLYELKNRKCSSTTYGDVELSTDKYNSLCCYIAGDYTVMLVYFWYDGWTMINLDTPPTGEPYRKYARKTTNFFDTGRVEKEFVHWTSDKFSIIPYDKD